MELNALNLLLVLLAALGGGWIARRLGYPAILGEIGAGILLGPPLLGLLSPDEALNVIGKLGVTLLMLYIGLHLDPTDLGRTAKAGSLAAAGGFLVPAGLGFGLMMLVDGDPVAATFVAVAMGVTSLATKSRILVDLDILNTRIAHVLMTGALFSDIGALVVFAAVLGLAATGTIAVSGILLTAAKAAAFLAASWVVGRRLFPIIGRRLSAAGTDPTLTFFVVVLAGLAFAAAADAAGLHAILGAFIAGLYVREGVLDHSQLVEVERRTRNVSVGLLAPVFFVTAGFKVSFDVFTEAPLLLAGIVVLATVGKIFGTALFYLPTGYGFREGIAVGAGMNGRGAVEIIVAELALAAGLIDATVFSILVFMAIFTTATVPVLLSRAVNRLRRRGELVADERDGIVVVGAGAVALRLADRLAPAGDVAFVDTNADHCERAADRGYRALAGSGLDEVVLEDAGIRSARMVIAVTANGEVNLLVARLAVARFGVPEVFAAMPEGATGSMVSMLDELGAELLFGRPLDLQSWDTDLDAGRVEDLDFEMADPEDILLRGNPVHPSRVAVETLPMVIQSAGGTVPFSERRELDTDSHIGALGRPRPRSGHHPRRLLATD